VSLGRNLRRQDSSLKETSSVGPNTNRGLSKWFKIPLRMGLKAALVSRPDIRRRRLSALDRSVDSHIERCLELADLASWPKNKTAHGYRNNQSEQSRKLLGNQGPGSTLGP
jgi:hypothetical protein